MHTHAYMHAKYKDVILGKFEESSAKDNIYSSFGSQLSMNVYIHAHAHIYTCMNVCIQTIEFARLATNLSGFSY